MVVMVSTDWCPPCQMMKKTVMPRVRERGLLRKVAFAMVNPDRDGELAEQITGGGPIPQLVMFRRTTNGWIRKKLIGGQSVETVEEFISEGLTQDAADKKASTATGSRRPRGPIIRPPCIAMAITKARKWPSTAKATCVAQPPSAVPRDVPSPYDRGG